MTVHEAIHEIELVGAIRIIDGRMKLSFPEGARERLNPAITVLRSNREAALDAFQNRGARFVPDSKEPRSISWAQWKADQLNRLFLEQGVTRQPGKITAKTIRDGMGRA